MPADTNDGDENKYFILFCYYSAAPLLSTSGSENVPATQQCKQNHH